MVYSINEIRDKIIPICNRYSIAKIGVFGSYAKGKATEESDIDLLVEFNESFDLFKYNQFIEELETFFNKSIDILDYRCIWEVLKDDILSSEVRVL